MIQQQCRRRCAGKGHDDEAQTELRPKESSTSTLIETGVKAGRERQGMSPLFRASRIHSPGAARAEVVSLALPAPSRRRSARCFIEVRLDRRHVPRPRVEVLPGRNRCEGRKRVDCPAMKITMTWKDGPSKGAEGEVE